MIEERHLHSLTESKSTKDTSSKKMTSKRLSTIFKHISSVKRLSNSSLEAYASDSTHCQKEKLPTITVESRISLYDEKVKISLSNFPSNEKVTLHGQCIQGKKKFIFASCGHYMTNESGEVKLWEQPSTGGTYTGLEPMGLLWSLQAAPGQPRHIRMLMKFTDRPSVIQIKAYQGHLQLEDIYQSQSEPNSVADIQLERWLKSSDVKRIEVKAGNVRGALYLPSGEGPFQGVIDMFGSSGGIIEYRAALFASHGFAALALPYFQYQDLPKVISEATLDYFEEAVNWLASHPNVYPHGIGVVGVSKGAEIAYCMSAYLEQIRGNPPFSSLSGRFCGTLRFSPNSAKLTIQRCKSVNIAIFSLQKHLDGMQKSEMVKCAVIINGLPYYCIIDLHYKGKVIQKGSQFNFSHFENTDEGYVIGPGMEYNDNLIPAWQGDAKHLILVSEDDYQVIVENYKLLLEACPEEKKSNFEVVKYPGAGHLLEPPYTALCRAAFNPTLDMLMLFGGQMKEHAHAQEDSWQRILDHLRKNIPTS